MKLDDITNPPAFAQNDLSGYGMGPVEGNPSGMTLLDYFAGQALNAYLQSPQIDTRIAENAVHHAYGIAAKMLEERKKYL